MAVMARSHKPVPLLVRVDLRHNHVKMCNRWFWEVVDDQGRSLLGGPGLAVRVHDHLGHGVFPFGWARSEASAYRQARRMKWTIRARMNDAAQRRTEQP